MAAGRRQGAAQDPRGGAGTTLIVAALLAGCSGAVSGEASVFLSVDNGPGAPVPELVRLEVRDDSGVVFPSQRLPASGRLIPAGPVLLGTVAIYPGAVTGFLRLSATGEVGGEVRSRGEASTPVTAHRQTPVTLVLDRIGPGSGDAAPGDADLEGAGGDAVDAPADPSDLVPGDGPVEPADGRDGPDVAPGVNGAPCATASACSSGHCVDGVCCASACTGTCVSCAVAGAEGVCTAVPAAADPRGDCPDEGAAGCGRDGTCNGAGACRLYGGTALCAAQICTGSVKTLARTCDGTGTCPGATVAVDCAPYRCAAAGVDCRTSCTDGTHCVAPAICLGGLCVPPDAGVDDPPDGPPPVDAGDAPSPPATKVCLFGVTPGGGCTSDAECPIPALGACLGTTLQGTPCADNSTCAGSCFSGCSTNTQCPAQVCRYSGTICRGTADCRATVYACAALALPATSSDFRANPVLQCAGATAAGDTQCTTRTAGAHPYCRRFDVSGPSVETCLGYNDALDTTLGTHGVCDASNNCNGLGGFANAGCLIRECVVLPNRCVDPPTTCSSLCTGTCSARATDTCRGDSDCDTVCTSNADCGQGRCAHDASVLCTTDAECAGQTYCIGNVSGQPPRQGGLPILQRCLGAPACATKMAGIALPGGSDAAWVCGVPSGVTARCLGVGNLCLSGRCTDGNSRACRRLP